MTAKPDSASVDDYVPGHGDPTYDVRHYDLRLSYSVATNRLSARAAITAVALVDLERFALDLHHLKATKVSVDGTPVAKFKQKHSKLEVRLGAEISAGTSFAVVVSYGGGPKPMPGVDGDAGWEELADGVIVAGQPHGAPSWFPCNDRPDNKASYRIEVTTGADYLVVCNGALLETRRGASGVCWVFEQPEPMATYLATVQIGRYVTRVINGSPVPMNVVFPPRVADDVDAAFRRQSQMLRVFTRLFGRYPFGHYTVVVTDDDLEIPLEAQGLSIFGANFLDESWETERLIAHELAHQWFGNSLTLRDWSDIWLHEGFACYSEWLWSEESGSRTVADHAEEQWARLAELPEDLLLGDPGPELMFDDRLYKRGALLLQAVRLTIGDEAFSRLLREWVLRYEHGSVTTADFEALADEVSGESLDELFRSWLDELELPSLPGAS